MLDFRAQRSVPNLVPNTNLLIPNLVADLAQLLTTRFLILQYSMMSTAEQIKNVAGHQAKCTIVFGLVLKRDRHDETKGQLPAALTNKNKHLKIQDEL